MEQEAKKMELLEARRLAEWDGDLLPEDTIVYLEHCDETDQPMVMIWKKAA